MSFTFFLNSCLCFKKKNQIDPYSVSSTKILNREYNSMTLDIPDNIDPKNIPKFVPDIQVARVIKVYDGDTITIASYYPNDVNKLYKFSVRLYGIDCPEKYSKIKSERDTAELATHFLTDLILNKIVTLHIYELDKYGRLLADVFINGLSCSHLMLENRYAVKYNGKTKRLPENWMYYYKYGSMYDVPIDKTYRHFYDTVL